jgi:hypothetical protein
MDDTNGGQMGGDQDYWEAIRSDDCQWQLWAVGEERIARGASYYPRVTSHG